ncbi:MULTISPECIES: DUF397 domain-containing protein [Streptomyces]|uniref:DUF397 domain-containing protein n=1 Tax=Streptomyces TaxID=1883 RepID=UPI0004CD6C86|nr:MULTISPECIES: DUF397 domain-containing protein [Streptomyces]KOX27851.1 hypothetical protein ADL07_28820 [Streptomyces sp. NRRL F-4707]MCL7364959.1 DUF397 domain-containing protein [Streptomyces ardesiacus]NEB64095.1 DUF397 domain-containing protein [Streptomyces diastaticus]
MSDQLNWRKSSYSDDEGGDCVEVAAAVGAIHIRDSKTAPAGPELRLSAPAWSAFIAAVRPGA